MVSKTCEKISNVNIIFLDVELNEAELQSFMTPYICPLDDHLEIFIQFGHFYFLILDLKFYLQIIKYLHIKLKYLIIIIFRLCIIIFTSISNGCFMRLN